MNQTRPDSWKWYVCGLLLMATMLNYMDRQTLSLTITDISRELHLNNEQYGNLETGFGLAFAAGGLFAGLLVDRLSVRWLYPLMFIGWSLAGVATAYAHPIGVACAPWLERLFGLGPPPELDSAALASRQAYLGLMVCRSTLGFFEAGHWPCALVTVQRLLRPSDRPFGNSLLQSGASIGAILTPLVVQLLVSDQPGSWRSPFLIIGLTGMLWVVPWLLLIRGSDLRPQEANEPDAGSEKSRSSADAPAVRPADGAAQFWPRFAALVVTVVMINLTWQYFRVWLPKFLREYHEYDRMTVNFFTSAFYISTDVGCIAAGFAVKYLAARQWSVHRARMTTFLCCGLLTATSMVAAILPGGSALFVVLLVIGMGSLGLFPNYYAFTQELSTRRLGALTGVLGAVAWVISSLMQKYVGRNIDETQSYAAGIFVVGLAPLVAWLALALLWSLRSPKRVSDRTLTTEESG